MSFLDDLSDSGAASDLLNAVSDYSSNGDSYALSPTPISPVASSSNLLVILGAIVLAIVGFVLFEKR